MSASPAPRPLTDAEFNALSPDQLSALGFQPAQQGAPATFSGAVYPNPTNIKPVADTDIDKGEGTRLPTGVKMTYPINRGKPQMDTSNPAAAQILPSGSTTVQAKTTGTPVPADASLLEQLAGGQPKSSGTLLEDIASGAPSDLSTMPSGLPAGSTGEQATSHTLDQVIGGAKEGAVGLGKGIWQASQAINPAVQAYRIAKEGLPAYIKSRIDQEVAPVQALAGVTQIPGAIKDINASNDSSQLYADAAARTGGNLLIQGVAGVAGDEAQGATRGLDTDAVAQAAKKTGLDAIHSATPKTIQKLLEFADNYREAKAANAAPETAPATAADAVPAKPTPRVKTAVTGTPAPGAPDVATANGYTRPAVLTNPQDIASAVDDIVKGKTGRQAPMKATDLENSIKSGKPVQTPFDVTEGARQTIAKDIEKTAGPAPAAKSPATTSKISGETEALRNRPTTVDGKEVNPDADFSAALKESVNRLGTKTTPEEGGPSEGYTPVSHLESDVPARGFLNKMGADEASVVKTDADHQSVQYHRQQIKNGQTPTARLDIDEEGNVIGGDGRHRAIAAIQEGGPTARMKVKVVQHSFKGVE